MNIKKTIIYKKAKKVYLLLFGSRWKQKNISFGEENSDKIFYVIRRRNSESGLMSNLIVFLGHLKYAHDMCYTPIIDYPKDTMKSKSNILQGVNLWDSFFHQPDDYDLSSIKNSKNVIYSTLNIPSIRPDTDITYFTDVIQIEYWRNIYKKYIHVKEDILNLIEIERKRLISKDDIVLGIFLRGTDYVSKKPYLHPIQPSPEMIIEKSEEFIKKHNCNKVFIVTEDQSIYNIFRDHFGNSMISVDTIRFVYTDQDKEYLNQKIRKNNIDLYKQNFDYLTSLVILSKCDFFLSGMTSGSLISFLMGDEFKETFIWDLGKYGVKK